MITDILKFLKDGQTYSLQALADKFNTDIQTIKVQIEYLERYDYIKKVEIYTDCNNKCGICKGCSYRLLDYTMWELA